MFENLSKEVLEKVKQAKSKEEALELLKQNGITLSDEDLAGAAGGESCEIYFPPRCDHDCLDDFLCLTNQSCTGFCPMDTVCPLNCEGLQP